MLETNGHMHVKSPGAGTDNPLGSNILHEHTSSVNLIICCRMFSWNYFITIFPIQTHRQPSLTFLLKGQDQFKVIIYTNSVAVEFLVLNAKFQDDKTFGTCKAMFKKSCYHI